MELMRDIDSIVPLHQSVKYDPNGLDVVLALIAIEDSSVGQVQPAGEVGLWRLRQERQASRTNPSISDDALFSINIKVSRGGHHGMIYQSHHSHEWLSFCKPP